MGRRFDALRSFVFPTGQDESGIELLQISILQFASPATCFGMPLT